MSRAHRTLVVGLGGVATAIVVQAGFAGLFLSGQTARTPHTIVGSLLPYASLVPAVSAVRRRRRLRAPLWVGATVLPVLLWLQMALGHLPWPGATALHVPLGVLLFGGSLLLAGAAARAPG